MGHVNLTTKSQRIAAIGRNRHTRMTITSGGCNLAECNTEILRPVLSLVN